MRAQWVAPPAVLIGGAIAVSGQLRRIGSERRRVLREADRLSDDRRDLDRVTRAIGAARASLDRLARR